jgi:hypothetical protein
MYGAQRMQHKEPILYAVLLALQMSRRSPPSFLPFQNLPEEPDPKMQADVWGYAPI